MEEDAPSEEVKRNVPQNSISLKVKTSDRKPRAGLADRLSPKVSPSGIRENHPKQQVDGLFDTALSGDEDEEKERLDTDAEPMEDLSMPVTKINAKKSNKKLMFKPMSQDTYEGLAQPSYLNSPIDIVKKMKSMSPTKAPGKAGSAMDKFRNRIKDKGFAIGGVAVNSVSQRMLIKLKSETSVAEYEKNLEYTFENFYETDNLLG